MIKWCIMKYKLAGCKFTDTVTQTNTYIHKSHKISLVNGSTEGMYVVPIAAPTVQSLSTWVGGMVARRFLVWVVVLLCWPSYPNRCFKLWIYTRVLLSCSAIMLYYLHYLLRIIRFIASDFRYSHIVVCGFL